MINPSALGWIDKYFTETGSHEPERLDVEDFYLRTRATGFIYGHIISFGSSSPIEAKGWTSEEISKVALLNILYRMHHFVTGRPEPSLFIREAVAFYNDMHPGGSGFLKTILPSSSPSIQLEKIIDDRVQTNDNMFSKNFSHIVTNALLFEDVLAFRQFLIHGAIPDNYLKKLEETIVAVVSSALSAKTRKTEYDNLLTKLFEASVRYTKFSKTAKQSEQPSFDYFTSPLERYYLLDMAVLALWSDGKVEQSELDFIAALAASLYTEPRFIETSIADTDRFIRLHKNEIPYFHYSNPVKHFYDQASQTVMLLISRNKSRLSKELSNNGELMMLLTHSTHRSLEDKEKKKVKKQLLEICKTIPSLTIFLLPGGSLLLPLLIKFIPKMLPSTFNENLDTE